MRTVFEAAVDLSRMFEDQQWSFCIIGGIAVVRWGRARATVDVDVTLLTGFGVEDQFVDALLSKYASRRADAREFALKTRILLLESDQHIGIDVALAGFPFEQRTIERSSSYEFYPGVTLNTCGAEDLIISKAFAGRPRDWSDIEGVILNRGGQLNWSLIEGELGHLCDLVESREPLEALLALRAQLLQ